MTFTKLEVANAHKGWGLETHASTKPDLEDGIRYFSCNHSAEYPTRPTHPPQKDKALCEKKKAEESVSRSE